MMLCRLPHLLAPLLYLCVVARSAAAAEPEDVAVYQFQENDRPSDSYITLDRNLENVFSNLTSLSVCARVRFFSLWEVSRFIQLTNEQTMEHTLQIDVDVRRIRVSLGGMRRYHTLNTKLQALTWHHLCVTYDDVSGETVSFLNGIKQDQHHTDVTPSVVGSKIKIGAGDASSNFHGELSQVNIWNRTLHDEEIRSLAMCKTNLEGNLITWSNDWISHGKVIASRESSQFFCKTVFDPKLYLFHPMRLYHAFALCEGLGGYLPTPENETSLVAYQKAVLGLSSSGNIRCEGYWIGATDEKDEGFWKRMTDGKIITPHWKQNEPDGGEVQNCAQGTLGEDMAVKDIPCDGLQCVLCELPKLPTWSLLGACQIHDRNRLFAPVQNKPGDLVFEGYSFYTIEKQNNTWQWVERHGENENRTIAKLISGSSIRKSWPIGRQSWQFHMSVCEEEPGEIRTLLFSPCKEGHFTCDDATCIPLFQRCDLKPDCRDGSDEKDCRLVQFPATYRSDIPPAALGSENPLQVALHVTIESADINTASMMMHVNFNLTMTWSDQRLEFLNLNEDRTLNRVKQETVEKVWVPVVDFTNTKGNHYTLADHESTMMVNMQSLPYMGDDAHAEEVEVYPGTKNSLSIRRKYSKTFQCQFDLTRYPFDKQGCEMELTMLSASSRLLQFDEERTAAEFSGNRHLIEYTVGDVRLHFKNSRDFAVLFVEVELTRRAGFILMNIYIPSMCLLVISYLTLYFKPAIFQVRMLGSLTTLLVMATLFTQASSQLPKSSYFKLVDVWLLSSILIIFTIIVFHAIIDRLQDTPKPAIPKHPLSAIIIKPDIGQGRNFKPRSSKKDSPVSVKSPPRSRSKGSHLSSGVSRNSMDVVNASSPAPHTPEHEEHELVTTFEHLGVGNESPTSSKMKEENPRKRASNKIGDGGTADNPSSSATESGDNGLSKKDTNATVGQTYREPPRAKNGDSFIAMERAESDGENSDDDVGTAILRRGIEWKFWKWSFNDVDKCKTMIVTSRIVVFLMVIIFNIIYWSIALNAE